MWTFDITKLSDKELKEYISELEEIIADPSGGSNTARDLLNAEKELKRRLAVKAIFQGVSKEEL